MRSKPKALKNKQNLQISVDQLEQRSLMATGPLGLFAIQQGVLAKPNQSVSERFVISKDNFQKSNVGPIMLRMQVDSAIPSTIGPLNLNSTQNPVGGKARPSTWQTPTTVGGLLARVKYNSYVVSAGYRESNLDLNYAVQYQIAGDVDGSFNVTRDDLALIRSGISDPASLTPEQQYNADVDLNGKINHRDLALAKSNLGAATNLRPLALSVGLGSDTPYSGANGDFTVRVNSVQIVAQTSPEAMVVMTNNHVMSEQKIEANAGGIAAATLPVQGKGLESTAAINNITVTATDAFGQSVSTGIVVDKRPNPVVIVPGYTASLPKTLTDLGDWLLNIGLPADKLAVIPAWTGMVDVYKNIQEMLSNEGYLPNFDQFIVPYDWRLPLAPFDGKYDGILSGVTGTTITQANPQFSLGYLGNFLKNMVKSDPSIVQIDMMGHSNGGLMTRSYIQSLAYGATVSENGQSINLPTVNKTILLAAPSEGAAMAWPVWNNDIANFGLTSTDVLQQFLKLPYELVLSGETITSPLGNITKATITDPVTGNPDPLKFLRLYGASLRDLLPTYDFLLTTGGQLTNINSDPASQNNLLLDINATSTPGVNPWVTRVGTQVTATYGVYPNLDSNLMTTQLKDQTTVADGVTGTIFPFQANGPIVPPAGTIYFVPVSIAEGDSIVPFVSQVATYAGDPRIAVVQWGNGSSTGQFTTWQKTGGFVTHSGFLMNYDVLQYLRTRVIYPILN